MQPSREPPPYCESPGQNQMALRRQILIAPSPGAQIVVQLINVLVCSQIEGVLASRQDVRIHKPCDGASSRRQRAYRGWKGGQVLIGPGPRRGIEPKLQYVTVGSQIEDVLAVTVLRE